MLDEFLKSTENLSFLAELIELHENNINDDTDSNNNIFIFFIIL